MKSLSDKALTRLRDTTNLPDLEGTRYALIQVVARGGMGVVYAARDEKLDRRVALKVLDAPDARGELADRLLREAQVLARLEHPGIVPVHDAGVLHDGRVFYTMKFVEGRRLDQHIESVTAVPDRLRLFLRICDAVAFAHARGVLHRDLKPANVMVGPFGEVLVMDWGLAKILDESGGPRPGDAAAENNVSGGHGGSANGATAQANFSVLSTPSAGQIPRNLVTAVKTTEHGAVMGTPGFMSPEQERGDNGRVDERSDIFCLGALLKFLLAQGPGSAASPANPSGDTLDKSLRAICAKACASSPQERYAQATQLAADVSRYLDGLPVSARRETFFDKATRLYRRNSVAILLITLYLAMRLLLLLFFRR